jgi:hypothetical protein
MSAQVFADKWEWLSKQSNWRKILNDTGISRIKRGWTVEQTVEVVRAQFPNTLLPWGDEGKSAFEKRVEAKKRLTQFKKYQEVHRRDVSTVDNRYNSILYCPKYKSLLTLHMDEFNKYWSKKEKMFARYKYIVEHLWKNNFDIHPTTYYQMFNTELYPPHFLDNYENPFEGLSLNLGLWAGAIYSNIFTDIHKLECYLDNALLALPQNLPTLPKHICQEYFDFAQMAMIEKKCIVCLESNNMLLSTCGHVICQDCFKVLKNQPEFKCPECRTVFPKE